MNLVSVVAEIINHFNIVGNQDSRYILNHGIVKIYNLPGSEAISLRLRRE